MPSTVRGQDDPPARRWYRVADSFVSRVPERSWVVAGRCYEGREASEVLPDSTVPWIHLLHPTEPHTTALVLRTLLTEMSEDCGQ